MDVTISILEIGLYDFECEVDFKPCDETVDVEAIYVQVPDGEMEVQGERCVWDDEKGHFVGTGIMETRTRQKWKKVEISTATKEHRAFYNMLIDAILADEDYVIAAEEELGIYHKSDREEHFHPGDYI